MNLEDEQRRGRAADQLLENPLLIEAFATIEQEIQAEWTGSKAKDADAREKLWLMLKLLGRVKAHVQQVSLTGQMATFTLREKLGGTVSPL